MISKQGDANQQNIGDNIVESEHCALSVGTENMRASMENSGGRPAEVKDGALSNTPKK